MISIRYGTMSDTRYKMHWTSVNTKWIAKDYLFNGWINFSPEILTEEIDAAKHRCDIDDHDFTFTFIEELPHQLATKFEDTDYYLHHKYSPKDYKNKIKRFKKTLKKKTSTINPSVSHEFSVINEENYLSIFEEAVKDNIFYDDSIEKGTKIVSNILKKEHSDLNSCSLSAIRHSKHVYRGDNILREIGLLEKATMPSNAVAAIITFIRILIIYGVQIYHGNYYFAQYWYEYIMVAVLLYLYISTYRFNIMYIQWGITDYKRKLFYMKILNSMISFDKDQKFAFSTYFPTINIAYAKNINSWMSLRNAWLDLGSKYTLRISSYWSVFLAFYTAFLIFTSLSLFGILDIELPIILYVAGYYDIIVILGILFIMLQTGAYINDYYDIHKGMLLQYK